MMRASSCWSLATRSTRRLHGTKMSVTGMIQIPNIGLDQSKSSSHRLRMATRGLDGILHLPVKKYPTPLTERQTVQRADRTRRHRSAGTQMPNLPDMALMI
ncbi:hypothetical protein PR202_gb09255 [Eleusine coracana subsp. coracana]|uniref:Uncharacterized protein n=1 Tax=Eleusine coracana subsp. coracana TaxID=191504 RepID=A0AAV5EHB3_ELECO|nr:hypothetical protein PR202_gb09255 [Eleusine coracana subsp. coracana]